MTLRVIMSKRGKTQPETHLIAVPHWFSGRHVSWRYEERGGGIEKGVVVNDGLCCVSSGAMT